MSVIKEIKLLILSLMMALLYFINYYTMHNYPLILVLAPRLLITSLLFFWVCRYKYDTPSRMPIKYWLWIALIGFFDIFLWNIFLLMGQQNLSVSITVIITGSYPLFVLLLSLFFVKDEKITVKKLLSITFGFFSIIFVFKGGILKSDLSYPLALVCLLLANCSWAISVILIKRLNTEARPLLLAKNITLLATGMTNLVFIYTLFQHPALLNKMDFAYWLYTCATAILCVLFMSFYIKIVQELGVNFAALTAFIVPFIGIALDVIFLKQHIPPVYFMSLLLLLFSLLLSRSRE